MLLIPPVSDRGFPSSSIEASRVFSNTCHKKAWFAAYTAPRHEKFVQAQGVELARRVDAVEIDVEEVDLRAVVLVNQGKGRAGNVVVRRGMQTLGNALYQRGLAGAEVAAQDDHARVLQRGRQLAA